MIIIKNFIIGLLFTVTLTFFSTPASAFEIHTLSSKSKQKIGRKIFKNECNMNPYCLTSWNKGETFASLGIGHFIWYPDERKRSYHESFPSMINFMKQKGVLLPEWLKTLQPFRAPWKTKKEFDAAFKSPEMEQLRLFLQATFKVQAEFMVNRLIKAIPNIANHAEPGHQAVIVRHMKKLLSTEQGTYALIDYLNFKGEGLLPKEQYNGLSWGVLQVLEGIPENATAQNIPTLFADSAIQVLTRRAQNAPDPIKEKRWLIGWTKRMNTYRQ